MSQTTQSAIEIAENPATGEPIGQNVHASRQGDKLLLVVDLGKPGTPSASGKSLTIGTTRGNATYGGVTIGLNVYRKR